MKLRDDCLSRVLLFLAVIFIFPLMARAQNLNTNALPVPTLPSININNLVNITNFGAVSSTTLTNTTAIQAAINSAATTNGGCTVEIPAGTYLSGPLTLKSSINLQIDSGATLKMLAKINWPGATTFLNGSSIHDVEISGSGTIDGNAHFGSTEWWGVEGTGTPASSRPNFIQFSSSSRILIQDVTLQNPPTFHVMIKNNNANITVQRITMNTPGDSPNTDAFDIGSTNVLIKDSFISVGDDDAEIGGSQLAAEITITNCTFGTGHGVSMGSDVNGSVSNVMVINSTFNGTDYGIRMKSNDATSGGSGEGGLVQNLSYINLGMTNIVHGAIVIYSYYGSGGIFGTPTTVTPFIASTQAVDVTTIPVWRNITISNVTATVVNGGVPGIIWARMEVPATNIFLSHVNITGSKSFDVYSAAGFQFVDSKVNVPSSMPSFQLFNAQITVSNSVPTNTLFTFDGLTTNVPGSKLNGSALTLYNAQGSLQNTNVFDDGPLTIGASTLTISNNLTLFPTTALNYTLGTNTTKVAVVGNLALGGIINITNGNGFAGGTYTLLTYTGTLSGSVPTLGAKPAGFTYSFDTSTLGQVNLIVTPPTPEVPANLVATPTNLAINLTWSPSANATGYNLKRGTVSGVYPTIFSGLTLTNYFDAAVTNGVTYFYVVSATNAAGESANSLEVSATPLPSATPTNIVVQASGNQLELSWPQDHLGWELQIQTNNLSDGLGTNWTVVPNSQLTNQVFIPINPANGSVFLRLMLP
jgi:polygalacturonase